MRSVKPAEKTLYLLGMISATKATSTRSARRSDNQACMEREQKPALLCHLRRVAQDRESKLAQGGMTQRIPPNAFFASIIEFVAFWLACGGVRSANPPYT